jgi:hypothetical protein
VPIASQIHEVFKYAEHQKLKPLVDDIQHMVAYVKRLEFQIKIQMQTPLQFLYLLSSQKR